MDDSWLHQHQRETISQRLSSVESFTVSSSDEGKVCSISWHGDDFRVFIFLNYPTSWKVRSLRTNSMLICLGNLLRISRLNASWKIKRVLSNQANEPCTKIFCHPYNACLKLWTPDLVPSDLPLFTNLKNNCLVENDDCVISAVGDVLRPRRKLSSTVGSTHSSIVGIVGLCGPTQSWASDDRGITIFLFTTFSNKQ